MFCFLQAGGGWGEWWLRVGEWWLRVVNNDSGAKEKDSITAVRKKMKADEKQVSLLINTKAVARTR